jgi:hypothetical protein
LAEDFGAGFVSGLYLLSGFDSAFACSAPLRESDFAAALWLPLR